MTGQGLVDAVAGDQSTDRHFDTHIDVRVISQSTAQPSSWVGAQLASRTQETCHEYMASHCERVQHFGLPQTRKGEAELKFRSMGRGAADFFLPSARAVSSQIVMSLEGPAWEALWTYLNVAEISQTRVTVQEFNDATKYRPYCEVFFFLMGPEPERGQGVKSRESHNSKGGPGLKKDGLRHRNIHSTRQTALSESGRGIDEIYCSWVEPECAGICE